MNPDPRAPSALNAGEAPFQFVVICLLFALSQHHSQAQG